jgi:hypothetical protein
VADLEISVTQDGRLEKPHISYVTGYQGSTWVGGHHVAKDATGLVEHGLTACDGQSASLARVVGEACP